MEQATHTHIHTKTSSKARIKVILQTEHMFEQEDSCSNPCLQKISCPAEWIVTFNSYVTCLLRKTTMMETLSLICTHTIFLLACDDCSFPELIAACICFASSSEDRKEDTNPSQNMKPSSIQASSELRGQDDLPILPTMTGTQLAQCVLWLLDFAAMSSCATPKCRLTDPPLQV